METDGLPRRNDRGDPSMTEQLPYYVLIPINLLLIAGVILWAVYLINKRK